MKNKIILLILSCSFLGAQELSFERAWILLQERNDGLKAKEENYKRAKTLDDANEALYLPLVSIDATYTYLGGTKPVIDLLDLNPMPEIKQELGRLGVSLNNSTFTTEVMNQHTYLATLNAKWDLFDGFQREAVNDISELEIAQAKMLKEIEREKLFMELVTLYYGNVMAKALHNVMAQAENSFLLHYQNAQKLYEHSQIAKLELLNAKMLYENSKVLEQKSAGNMRSLKNSLSLLMHEETTANSDMFISNDAKKESLLKDEMLKNSKTLKTLDIKAKQADAAINLQEGLYYPKLFAYGTYNLYKDDSIAMQAIPQWFVGLGLNINLLSPMGRNDRIEAAKITHQELKLLYTDLEVKLASLLNVTYNKMTTALQEYNGLEATIEVAKENLKLQQSAFREGMVNSNSVVDAQLFLTEAKTQRLAAAYEFVTAYAEVLMLSGNISQFEPLSRTAQKVKP